MPSSNSMGCNSSDGGGLFFSADPPVLLAVDFLLLPLSVDITTLPDPSVSDPYIASFYSRSSWRALEFLRAWLSFSFLMMWFSLLSLRF